MRELQNRRDFIKQSLAAAAMTASITTTARGEDKRVREYKISCDGWTFHREVFGGKIKTAELFQLLREEFNVDGLALVNTMLEVPTQGNIRKLKNLAAKFNVAIPLIMCDDEGQLGHRDTAERDRAIRNHAKWIYMASDLGCHSIRVNWGGADPGTERDPEKARQFIDRSVETFATLTEIGRNNGINIIIENHGGPSSYPDILVGLMKAVNSPHFGTLPDFGNFPPNVDRYDAIDKMMPYAKAVSAKCHDFGPDGNETKTDFEKMIQICVDKHGYHGLIGVEYEGDRLSEREGMKAGRDLLLRLRG